MYIVRSFYQMADGEWITTTSGGMSKADADFLKDRLYFHFRNLYNDGIVKDYCFAVEEVQTA